MKFVLLSHVTEINFHGNRNQMGKFFGRYLDAEIACRQAKKTLLLSHTCIMELVASPQVSFVRRLRHVI